METKKTAMVVFFGLLAIIILAVGGLYLLWLPHSSSSQATSEQDEDPAMAALHRLEADTQNQPDFTFQNGFMRGAVIEVPSEGGNTVERARNFLKEYQDLYLQNDPALELHVRRIEGDDDEYVLFFQTYHGIEVLGSEILVMVYGENVTATVGALLPAGVLIDTYPLVSADEALEIARDYIERPDAMVVGEIMIMVYDPSINEIVPPDPHLVWRVPLGPGSTHIVYVDAHDGEVLMDSKLTFEGYELDHEDANGYPDGNVDCYWNTTDDDYIGSENGLIEDYLNDTEAVHSWWYSHDTYYFFLNQHGRDSFNGSGAELELYIYSGTDNARWVGGPGCDLIEFRQGWVGWDVMVHEYSHGIQFYTSQIGMHGGYGQHMSLRESFADIQGILADPGDWTVGENRTGISGIVRSISNPGIKHMDQIETNGSKAAGYHNSGIPSFAAYQMTMGVPDLAGTGPPLGRTSTGNLYYSVMKILGHSAQFIDARNAMISTAAQWYADPSKACTVRNAWAFVGVGQADIKCDNIPDPDITDTDGDHIIDAMDNCIEIPNPFQKDVDYDGAGDECDIDDDNDSVPDNIDNCYLIKNTDQSDVDNDGIGDLCDDEDGDGILDIHDNCVFDSNPWQIDSDDDGLGNACDPDLDGDGVPQVGRVGSTGDNCPFEYNPDQLDSDGDGIGDECDDCPNDYDYNQAYTYVDPLLGSMGVLPQPYQPDSDGDGIPDACDDDIRKQAPVRADGKQNELAVRPDPGGFKLMRLPTCEPEEQGFYPQNYYGMIVLEGLDENTGVWLADSAGFGAAKTKTVGDQRVIEFKPRGGMDYFLLFGFNPNYPEDSGDEPLMIPFWMDCGEKEVEEAAPQEGLVPIPSDPSVQPPVLMLPLDDNMPVMSSRCDLFGDDMTLTMHDIPVGSTALTLFVNKPGGWPGLEFQVEGDDQPWEYSATMGSAAVDMCNYQGYQGRLYCDFLLPETYLDTYRTLKVFVNGCEDPIYQHDRVTIFGPEEPPTPEPTSACNADLNKRECIAAGGTYDCDAATGACSCTCP